MQVSRQYILINEYDYEFHSCCWAKVDLSLIQVTWSQRCQDHRDEIQYVWEIIKMRVGNKKSSFSGLDTAIQFRSGVQTSVSLKNISMFSKLTDNDDRWFYGPFHVTIGFNEINFIIKNPRKSEN